MEAIRLFNMTWEQILEVGEPSWLQGFPNEKGICETVDSKGFSDEAWLAALKENNNREMIAGIKQKWWDKVDAKGNPVPFAIRVKKEEFTDKQTMAHVLSHVKFFESVSEAKKQGHNGPIKSGEFFFFNKKKRLIIE